MSDGWSTEWKPVALGSEAARRGCLAGADVLLGCGPADPRQDRLARLGALAGELGMAVRGCRQVHGRAIASLGRPHGGHHLGAAEVGVCDGLVTDLEGLALVVWTADCVPVLLAGDGVVAAIHAGWKGAAAGIVAAAVRRFQVEYGVPPDRVEAVLGPAVGPCHYPVGDDVVSALSHALPGERGWLVENRVDLRRFLQLQLAVAGVTRVVRAGPCTACDPALASYRRDHDRAGRQWSLVARSS